MSLILEFDDARATDLEVVGGKGASLAHLVQAGFPVPAGFTLTTAAYSAFIAENALEDKIAAIANGLQYDDLDELDRRAQQLRTLVEQGTLPPTLRAEIEQHYRALGDDVRVAVRSSATAEDLPDASFAGQHDTYLDVQTLDGIVVALKRCWASLWTARPPIVIPRVSPISTSVWRWSSSRWSMLMWPACCSRPTRSPPRRTKR